MDNWKDVLSFILTQFFMQKKGLKVGEAYVRAEVTIHDLLADGKPTPATIEKDHHSDAELREKLLGIYGEPNRSTKRYAMDKVVQYIRANGVSAAVFADPAPQEDDKLAKQKKAYEKLLGVERNSKENAIKAIGFAITLDDHYDRLEFLKSWWQGDTKDWKKFKKFDIEEVNVMQ